MIHLYARWNKQQLDACTIEQAQHQVLQQLLKQGSQSLFFEDHGLWVGMDYSSYQERVPLYPYETLWQRYIEPHQHQMANVLSQGDITHFARTSGSSSGKEKYMPVNHAFLKHMREAAKIQGLFNILRCTPKEREQLLWHPMLWLSDLSDYFNVGAYPTAMISRITRDSVRLYPRMVPSARIFDEVAAADRFQYTLHQACSQDLYALSGITPWLLHFCEAALAYTQKRYLQEIWPRLCFIMHAGVNFSAYQTRFERLLSRPVHLVESYVATEGFLGIQDLNSQYLRCLPRHGIFYEFIKHEERSQPHAKRYGLWQVEPGIVYSIVITNTAGFWSMEVGDTVLFERLLPYPRFQVCGRVQDKCDFFGEKLLLTELQQAIAQVCKKHQVGLQHFVVGPHSHERRLQLVIETHNDGPGSDYAQMEKEIDHQLTQLNTQYARNRRQQVNDAPHIHWVSEGCLQRWLARTHRTEVQTKLPQLFSQAEHLQQFINSL
jgi:hypothetical protein